jgi:hypothetical protein
MLPASTSSYEPAASWSEPQPYQPTQYYAYEEPYHEEDYYNDFEELGIEVEPVEPMPRNRVTTGEDWGISHVDLSDESLTKNWKEHNKSIGYNKRGKNYGNTKKNRSQRIHDDRGERSPQIKEKRDAVVFDGKGNELGSTKPKRKKKIQPKKKQPALIERAMKADKKMEPKPAKKQKTEVDTEAEADLEEILGKISSPPKQKQAASYERL